VGLDRLTGLWTETVRMYFYATTDGEGRFVFDKLPAGEFVVSVQEIAWQKSGQPMTKAFETPVTVQAGETRTVRLGGNGRAALARLSAKSFADTPPWSNALAVLRRDVSVPPMPERRDYVQDRSHLDALERWATDPGMRAKMREARTYVGEVSKDGTLRFDAVPPGRYVLDVKVFAPNGTPSPKALFGELPVLGRLRTAVSLPAEPRTKATRWNWENSIWNRFE